LIALLQFAGFQPAFAPRGGELNPKRLKEQRKLEREAQKEQKISLTKEDGTSGSGWVPSLDIVRKAEEQRKKEREAGGSKISGTGNLLKRQVFLLRVKSRYSTLKRWLK
jgi:hypothetical protein